MLTEVNVDLRKEEKGMKKQRKREREEGRRKRGREGGKSDRGRRKKGGRREGEGREKGGRREGEGREKGGRREGEGEVCKCLYEWGIRRKFTPCYTNHINVKLQMQLCGGCYFYFFLM